MDDKRLEELIRDLDNGDKNTRLNAAEALQDAAMEGHDISPAVPSIIRMMNLKKNGNVDIDYIGVGTNLLVNHYMNKIEWGRIDELLRHENEDVRSNAVLGISTIYLENLVQRKISGGGYSGGLAEIKNIASEVIKFYEGKDDLKSKKTKKWIIDKLDSLARRISEKMDKDKKKFPVKRQEVVRAQAKKVIASG